jgi:hypothetical protein
VARRRRHRRRHRGPRVDRPAGGRRPVVGLRPDGAAQGHAARPGHARLGPVARTGPVPAIPPRVPPDEVAGVAGLRDGGPRRHGLPHPRPVVLGVELGAPKTVEATSPTSSRRGLADLPAGVDRARVPGPRHRPR